MLNETLYKALAADGLLANKLHSHYVYHADREEQQRAKALIENLIKDYSDKKFVRLGFNKTTKALIKELISYKDEPNWKEAIQKFFQGLIGLLERELEKAEKIEKPSYLKRLVQREFKKIHIWEKGDLLEIEKIKDHIFEVTYTSMAHSPTYEKKFEVWRDTRLTFQLNFEKNLFVWIYINIHKDFRGKGIGSKLIKFCENLAKDLGFTRFSVEWPNRKFWEKHGYEIPKKYKIGTGKYAYTHEGYKES